jgi:hypothetical protein
MACGGHQGPLVDGPAKIVVTDASLQVRQTWPIGSCANGASVAADHFGDIAVSTYQFCNPPGTVDPHTLVAIVTNSARTILDVRGSPLALDDLTW